MDLNVIPKRSCWVVKWFWSLSLVKKWPIWAEFYAFRLGSPYLLWSLFLDRSLNVSKFQNEFMNSSFLPKYERNIVRISALYTVPHYRAEILTIFRSYFGRNDDFIISFWNLLTFSNKTGHFNRSSFILQNVPS